MESEKLREPLVAPSLLACDFARLGEEGQRMIDAGADWFHVDVMDGHFVPNIAIGFPVIKSLRKYLPKVYFDCHMMVSDPEKWIKPLVEAGGDQFVFHYESDYDNIYDLIQKIKDAGMKGMFL